MKRFLLFLCIIVAKSSLYASVRENSLVYKANFGLKPKTQLCINFRSLFSCCLHSRRTQKIHPDRDILTVKNYELYTQDVSSCRVSSDDVSIYELLVRDTKEELAQARIFK